MLNNRVEAFKECLLRTCVNILKPFYENLNYANCLDAEGFKNGAANLLYSHSLFVIPFEPAMLNARLLLLQELVD